MANVTVQRVSEKYGFPASNARVLLVNVVLYAHLCAVSGKSVFFNERSSVPQQYNLYSGMNDVDMQRKLC